MKKLHYDNSKDLYEGLITENDDGAQSQVAMVFPTSREEYGFKFAASLVMYEALKTASTRIHNMIRYEKEGEYRITMQRELKQILAALAKAEGKLQ